MFLPQTAYVGLVVGTIIFSAAGGLAEVLISPVVAALPSDNPEGDMSKLHSIYAWGVVGVIIVSTLYLLVFGSVNWQWLALGFMVILLLSCALFASAKLPEMQTPEKAAGVLEFMKMPTGGVFMYAMMAAGGDLGASIAPQLVGVITDAVAGNAYFVQTAISWGLTAEQLGMKAGLLVGGLFALAAIFVYLYILKSKKKKALPLDKIQ